MDNIYRRDTVVKVDIEGDENFSLDYSIIQNDDNIYGIEIHKQSMDKDCSESAVAIISDTKEDVLDLINKLARCNVTPVTLDYIIEDIFGKHNVIGEVPLS